MTAEELNTLDTAALHVLLQSGGGSTRWAELVSARAPYADAAAFRMAQELAWASISEQDWVESMAAGAVSEIPPGAADSRAAAEVALELYRTRFSLPFVSAALSTSADELLMRVRIRLGNDETAERAAARDELRRLVRQRLERTSASDLAPAAR